MFSSQLIRNDFSVSVCMQLSLAQQNQQYILTKKYFIQTCSSKHFSQHLHENRKKFYPDCTEQEKKKFIIEHHVWRFSMLASSFWMSNVKRNLEILSLLICTSLLKKETEAQGGSVTNSYVKTKPKLKLDSGF